MIKVQDLKVLYSRDKELAAEIAQVLGTSLKEITAKKAPAKKKASQKKEPAKKAQPAAPKKAAPPAPKKAAKPAKDTKKKAKASDQKAVAKDNDLTHDRTFFLLRSEDVRQKLAGLKKALEAVADLLTKKAKQAENYELSDEVEQTRDRIVMHLNALKSIAKEIA